MQENKFNIKNLSLWELIQLFTNKKTDIRTNRDNPENIINKRSTSDWYIVYIKNTGITIEWKS
jgi:hypothetical protein